MKIRSQKTIQPVVHLQGCDHERHPYRDYLEGKKPVKKIEANRRKDKSKKEKESKKF